MKDKILSQVNDLIGQLDIPAIMTAIEDGKITVREIEMYFCTKLRQKL